MATLINAKTKLAENVPDDQAQEAFLSGSHNLPANQKIALTDPEGKIVDVDPNEVYPSITQGGYRFASPSEIHNADMESLYGEGIGNSLKAFGLGVARTASLGTSDQFFTHAGVASPKALSELQSRHPLASGVGEVGGAIAPLFIPGAGEAEALNALKAAKAAGDAAEIAKAKAALDTARTTFKAADALNPMRSLTKAGRIVENSIAPLVENEAATGAAQKILGAVAPKAVGSAVEGAAFGLGQSVSEDALGDPDLTAQKVMANIGYSALFAGGIGGLLGLPSAFRKGDTEAESVIQGIQKDLNHARAEVPPDVPPSASEGARGPSMTPKATAPEGTIEHALQEMDVPQEKKQSVLQGLQELKPNAKEIVDAAKTIDAPVIESQISASKHVQNLDSVLSQSPTVPGIARQKLFQQGFDAAAKAIDSSLGAGTEMTQAEVGDAVRQGLISKFEAEKAPVEQLYSTIKDRFGIIPVNEKSTARISKNILGIDGIKLSPSSPQYQLAKSVADEIPNLKTVEDIKKYRSILRERTKGKPEFRFVAGQIQEKLQNLEENTVVRFAKGLRDDSELKPQIDSLLQDRRLANAKYASMREKMSEIGSVIGKKRIYGPQDFLDFLENDVTAEKLTDRLFAKKDSAFLKWFNETFPEESELLRSYQRGRIRDLSFKDGHLEASKALREIDKFSPEVKGFLFKEAELKRLNAAKTYLEAMPKNINPSGTSASEAYRRHFEKPLSMFLQTGADYAKLKAIENLVGKTGTSEEASKIGALVRLERAAQKTTVIIRRGARAALEGSEVGAAAAGSALSKKTTRKPSSEEREDKEKEFEKRSEGLHLWAQNPEVLLDKLESVGAPLYPIAPKITGGLHQSAVSAVGFLSSKLPMPPTQAPLSKKWKMPLSAITKFNRYYETVEDPTSALEKLKNGTLTPEVTETLGAVFPKLYDEMKSALMEEAINFKAKNKEIPYRKRLLLSAFLGQDMDGSLNPINIQKNQIALNTNLANQDGAPKAPNPTLGGLSKLTQNTAYMTAQQKSAARLDA